MRQREPPELQIAMLPLRVQLPPELQIVMLPLRVPPEHQRETEPVPPVPQPPEYQTAMGQRVPPVLQTIPPQREPPVPPVLQTVPPQREPPVLQKVPPRRVLLPP